MEKILLHFYRLIDNTNNIFLLSMLLINRLFQESFLQYFFVIDVIDKPIISTKFFANFFVSDVSD